MVQKKSFINLVAFVIFMMILSFLIYCSSCAGQIQNPFLFQSITPFGLGTSFPALNQIGSPFSYNSRNNFSNPLYAFGTNQYFGGILPFIGSGLAGNPYVAASTYYAAALLPADVVGAWSGSWTNTSALISVTGDLSLTLVQAINDVAGTLLFLAGGAVRLGCPVVGVVDVDILSITGSGVLAGKTPIPYEIVLTAGVVGAVMEGEYVITESLLGNVIEQGTFTASKL